METQVPNNPPKNEFSPGSNVIYGLHGRCKITQIDTRVLSEKSMRFYKLEVLKSPLSRSNRGDPAIWVPVETAVHLGLRAPMDKTQAEEATKLLANRESYYSLNESWNVIHPMLENIVRTEGSLGLAKVFSYLYVLKRKWVTPPKDIIKFYDSIHKLLFRELSDALGETARVIEERYSKALKTKPILDT